jgi:hypothetical protein
VAKLRPCFQFSPAQLSNAIKRRIEPDLTQPYDNSQVSEYNEFAQHERTASPDFFARQFVLGRGAVTHCRNVTIGKAKSVASAGGVRLIRKSVVEERTIQPVSALVTCENSSGAIPSVGGRGQAYDE